MARADKATAVADIAAQFKESTATLITEYRGLTVANLAELRRSLTGSATYAVAKKHTHQAGGLRGRHRGPRRTVCGPHRDRVRHR